MNDSADVSGEEKAISKLIDIAGPRQQPSAERAARVQAAVEEKWREKVRTRSKETFGWRRVSVAAALVVVSIGVVVSQVRNRANPAMLAQVVSSQGTVQVFSASGDLPAHQAAFDAGTRFETGDDGMIVARLASGHELRMHGNTSVELVSLWQLQLTRGTAYIDSGPQGASIALNVMTPFGIATDVGTQFEVSVSDDALEVAVREGIVELRDLPDLAVTKAPTVHRGQVWRRSGSEQPQSFEVAPWSERWRWTRQLAEFSRSEAPARDYVEWLCREHGVVFRADGSGVQERLAKKVSGLPQIVRADFDDALGDALSSVGLVHHNDGKGLIVVRRAP